MPNLSWLDAKHPVYKTHEERWKLNERRLRGGEDVLDELRPYAWEYEGNLSAADLILERERSGRELSSGYVTRGQTTEHYDFRRREATYVNFPELFALAMTGFMMRQAPEPGSSLNLGSLGNVRRLVSGRPSAAELVYYNVDGAGNDGSQWDLWWMSALRRAMATGHRWIFCDAPEVGAATEADWLAGNRPYLTEYSPLQVPLWHYDKGSLAFSVARFFRPQPRVVRDSLEGMDGNRQHYLLMVREGVEGLGDEYKRGGWWLYDPDKKLELEGDWESTEGQIPLFPLYYDRDRGTAERPSFSRAGLTELGQLAVSYLNLSSAWDFDVWDAAGSVQLLLGVTQDAFNVMTGMLRMGNKMAPVPRDDHTGAAPDVYDASQGAVSAEVFGKRLEIKRAEARELAAMESVGTPDASGRSKEAGFADLKSPRLALMASELEQAQNTAIHFLEQRFRTGRKPTGSVKWDRQFELLDILKHVREIFELETLARLRSTRVGVEGMLKVIKERGLVNDDEQLTEIRQQYEEAAESRSFNDNVEAALLGR